MPCPYKLLLVYSSCKDLTSCQIASLKAALARKEGAQQQHAQHSASGNEKFKTKASEISPFRPKSQDVDVLVEHAIRRQPMGDVGNIEVFFFFFLN